MANAPAFSGPGESISADARAAIAAAQALMAPRRRPAHIPVGPLSVFDGGIDAAADLCIQAARAGRGMRVATANLDFVARARRDLALKRDLEHSSLVVADGAPVAWMAWLGGGRRTRRVTGVDLVAALCARAGNGLRVAMYGSTPEIAEAAARRLESSYAAVDVVHIVCPPFRRETRAEAEAAIARMRSSRPDVVLVALGCPRQERFIAEHFVEIPGAVWVGVGGTFDFYAGKRRRAPKALRALGCEWLARLAQEPGRLWRRYLLTDLPGLVRVAPGVFRARRRPRPGELDELREVLLGAA